MKILPRFIINKIRIESFCIENFVRYACANTKKSDIFLDAGAGDCRYKPYFSHVNYIALDLCFVDKEYGELNTIGDLQSLPFKNEVFDSILCTQVLEHVKDPYKILCEFNRVLKPQGRLFLTVPQNASEHEIPFDYFRFTRFGLQSLLESAGFKVIFINYMGGYFWYIGNILRELPDYITKSKILKIFFNIFFKICVPLVCFYLDKFDKIRNYTINYSSHCVKRGGLNGK